MKVLRAIFRRLRRKNLKLRGQMYRMYIFALIIPLTAISVILVYNADEMLSEYYMEMLKGENARVKSLLSQITTQVYGISDEICLDVVQKDILSGKYEASVDFVREVNAKSEIDSIIYNYNQIGGIYIYTDNPTIANYKQYNMVTTDIAGQDWYQRAVKQSAAFWANIEGSNAFGIKNNTIALVRRILLPNSDYKAVLVIKLGSSYIRSRIDSNVEDVMSIDDGSVVYSSKSDWYDKELPVDIDYEERYYSNVDVVEVDGTKYFAAVSTSNLHMTNSRLYICTMNDRSYYDIRNIINMLIIILTVAVLVPGIILFIFARRFTGRVYLLRKEMHKASMREYDMTARFSGNDELTEAYEDLKTMVSDIKEKEAMVYKAELNEKELRNNQQIMEYKMLASQINPHYLYNTLETIRMKALTMGNKEVADCIKILGKTLQYVLKNTGTSATTLKKEIDHVENYLAIQKLRFGNRINYQIRLEEGMETERYEVLPLLLQPLVENAVVHGLEDIDDNGRIYIDISQNEDEQLQIIVSDNGKGMLPEEYEKIRKKLSTPGLKLESSIGVYNICERIRLHYGEEYGIRLESEYGRGTKVIMLLPVIKTM